MATYYVAKTGSNGAAGSSGAPWLTLAYAAAQVGPGDTVRVRAGTYTEKLVINDANVTFMADDANNRPVVDGNYHAGLFSDGALGKNSTLPDARGAAYLNLDGTGALISLNAAGVTLDGFIVQNVAGEAISLGASNTTVENCDTFFTFGTGIISNPGGNSVSGLTIQNNRVRFASMMIFEPNRRGYVPGQVQVVVGSIKVGNNNGDTIISGNEVAYGFGEGINVGKDNNATASAPIIVEDNIVHDCNHSHIYINGSRFVHVRRNIVYCTNAPLNLWDGDSPAGIRLKDEKSTYLRNIFVYNNVIVNVGIPIMWGERHTASTDCYFGYNTIVGGPQPTIKKKAAILIVTQQTGGTASQKGVMENNLIDYSMTTAPVFKNNGEYGLSGAAFRHNGWSSAPDMPAAQRVGDVVGGLRLANPTAALATSNYLTRANTTYASLTISDNFNLNNYRLLATSDAIGAASNRRAFNGVTPPVITTDNEGNTRTDLNTATPAYYDIGALEYGAAGGGGASDSVTAAFSQSVTSGIAPLTVAFTDTSSDAGAAAIDSRRWDYGNGVERLDVGSHSYTYPAAGTFTPSLTVYDTVRGLSDVDTGTAITVNAPPTGATPGYVDVVRFAMPTTAGTKTIPFNLGGHAPALVLLFMSKATAAGAAADDAMLCYGAVTGNSQWVSVFNSNDGEATTVTERYASILNCLASLTDGALSGKAERYSMGADQLVINITDAFPAAYLCTAMAFAGAQFTGVADSFTLGSVGEETRLTPGFLSELMLFGGGGATALGTVEDSADFTFGAADGTREYAFSWRDVNALAAARQKASISSEGVAIRQPTNTATASFSDYSAGKLLVAGQDFNRMFTYAALNVGGGTAAQVRQFSSPTATGVQSYGSYGYRPAGVLILFSTLGFTDAHDGATAAAEGFAIVAADAGATYCTSVASDQGAAATNSKSRVDNSIVVIDGTGATILAGALTFTSTGFQINWTTVQSTARHFIAVAVGETASITGPIPQFAADTTEPVNGTVNFTDLSSANGAAITARLWTFGDGATSTSTNPSHTYASFGTYTVSLTVTNANGSETLTRVNYIRYLEPESFLYGSDPLPITNYSTTKFYADDPTHPNYGAHSHEVLLGSLQFDAYPEDTDGVGKPGMARLVIDHANNRLKLIFPDGTVWGFTKD